MTLFPAIDLKQGACVRLERGLMQRATVFNDRPAQQARLFANAGCDWLHVIDLDGAFAGRSVNAAAVRDILAAVDVRIQLGGGIRTLAALAAWLEAGVTRVILGTAAHKDPALVRESARLYPGRIVVGIDARDGRVAIEGWAESTELAVSDLARRFEDCGVAAIIHTDIDRDGMLQGMNIEATAALAEAISIPVIASGGVASLADLRAVRAHRHAGVIGAICGRSLYDGRVDLAEGLAIMRA